MPCKSRSYIIFYSKYICWQVCTGRVTDSGMHRSGIHKLGMHRSGMHKLGMHRSGVSPGLPAPIPVTLGVWPDPCLSLLVGGSLSPSACDASSNNAQRVIMTRWRLSLPLRLRRQLQRPPTSHYDSLEALSPPLPATPAPTTPKLVGGSLSPSACNASSNNAQRVIMTPWRLSLPL